MNPDTPLFPDYAAPPNPKLVNWTRVVVGVVVGIALLFVVGSVVQALGNNVDAKFDRVQLDSGYGSSSGR